MNPCFYCGEPMTRNMSGISGALTDTDQTIEHVIPRMLMRFASSRITSQARLLNTVFACHGCNSYKGNLSPLDWLVIMPSNEGATRLGELLMRMGCTIDEVAKAMGRRA